MSNQELSTHASVNFAPEETRDIVFDFKGDANSYFGVWIVNIFLTILTVGIYSAWAKVRRLRYFYGNTYLDGHNFDFHARPLSILLGRIVVVGALAIYQALTAVHPAFGLLIVPYLFAYPWLINKSLAFHARMTSHRNLRFGFEGRYGRAFVVYLLFPLLALVTVGLALPLATRARWRYFAENLRYGDARFSAYPTLGALYANLGASAGFGLAMVVGLGFLFGGLAALGGGGRMSVFHWIVIFVYLGLILSGVFYRAGARNIGWSSIALDGGHRFKSTLGRRRSVWIAVSNVLVTIMSFGLMRPWAAVRSWRYQTVCTSLVAASSLDAFVGRAGGLGNVAASEFADIEGIDLGL